MRALVNGNECSVNVEGMDSVGDLVEQLRVHAPPDDVIVGLRINGIDCEEDPASQVRALPVVGVSEIDLETRAPGAFADEAGGRIGGYLAAIRQGLARAVEAFDQGLTREALGHYRRGVEELGLLIQLCGQLARLGVDTRPDTAITDDLKIICDRLWAAQDAHDFTALRGVLADRLLPLLVRWDAGATGF
jgi:hypothetical protein